MNWTSATNLNIYRKKLNLTTINQIVNEIQQYPTIQYKNLATKYGVTRQAIAYQLSKKGIKFKRGRVKNGTTRERI